MRELFEVISEDISASSDYLDPDEVYDTITKLLEEHHQGMSSIQKYVPYMDDVIVNMNAIFNKDNRYTILSIASARLPDSLIFTITPKED